MTAWTRGPWAALMRAHLVRRIAREWMERHGLPWMEARSGMSKINVPKYAQACDADGLAKGETCAYCGWSGEMHSAYKPAAVERPGYADGVLDTRRMYAQAWCDATGESIHAVLFSDSFLRDRVAGMRATLDALRVDDLHPLEGDRLDGDE